MVNKASYMVNNTVKVEPNKAKVGPFLRVLTLQPYIWHASDLDCWIDRRLRKVLRKRLDQLIMLSQWNHNIPLP